MRNSEVIRQWKVLRGIEAGRFASVPELAREHKVTERTIRRDLEALQEAGFPIYDELVERRRVWRLLEPSRQRVMQGFTLAELAALYFGRNLMGFLGGSPLGEDLESAFEKIRQALPERSLPYLSRIQDLFAIRPDPWKDYSHKRAVIEALIDAVLHQRRVKADYYSFHSQRAKTYLLDPYRVAYYRGGLYLYARVEEYGEIRTFAVERIGSVGAPPGNGNWPPHLHFQLIVDLRRAEAQDLARRHVAHHPRRGRVVARVHEERVGADVAEQVVAQQQVQASSAGFDCVTKDGEFCRGELGKGNHCVSTTDCTPTQLAECLPGFPMCPTAGPTPVPES